MPDSFDVDYLYENPGEQLHIGADGKAKRVSEIPNLFSTQDAPGTPSSPGGGSGGLMGTKASPMADKQLSKQYTEEDLQKFAEDLKEQMYVQEMQPSAVDPALRQSYGNAEIPAWLQQYMQNQPTTGTQMYDAVGNNKYLSEEERRKYK